MTLRHFVITAPKSEESQILKCAESVEATGITVQEDSRDKDLILVQLLTSGESQQELLDGLQSCLDDDENWRITMLPVETTVPFPEAEKEAEEEKEKNKDARSKSRSREEIYNSVWTNARLDWNYAIFVILSTVVASIGMITDNVAVVVGAMVIAPLLGPNLAFAVGVALGDEKLMLRAALTNISGIVLALALSLLIGLAWPSHPNGDELMARSYVGYDGMVVALASGAAAALSLVTGVSSALVGVMVAVALLPPTAAIGLFAGAGQMQEALGATLLLAVNVVCVNLAAQAVMITRGITPRTWFEKKKARNRSIVNAIVWAGLLLALGALMWFWTPTPP